jgi:CDP-4-dehydro-6-deoxyglucose reductase
MNFRITLLRSGTTFEAYGNESILNAALRHGVQLPYGCRNGQCGSCKAQVIHGEVRYPSDAETDALTHAERETGWCLCCQAFACGDLQLQAREVGAKETIEVRTLPARVARLERLSHDVLGIWLQLPKSERLVFRAGQYVEILMRDGHVRAFSLANAPHDDSYLELHVRYYAGGAFAEYAFKSLHERELLRIRGPYGTFTWQEASSRPAVFVAGGTGFAPIKGVIEHVFAKGVKQALQLYWGVRAERDLYSKLPQQWLREQRNFSFVPVLSEPRPEDNWKGRTGLVHEALAQDFSSLDGYDVYACGPPIMTKAVAQTCAERGLAAKHVYSDAFEFAAQAPPPES